MLYPIEKDPIKVAKNKGITKVGVVVEYMPDSFIYSSLNQRIIDPNLVGCVEKDQVKKDYLRFKENGIEVKLNITKNEFKRYIGRFFSNGNKLLRPLTLEEIDDIKNN